MKIFKLCKRAGVHTPKQGPDNRTGLASGDRCVLHLGDRRTPISGAQETELKVEERLLAHRTELAQLSEPKGLGELRQLGSRGLRESISLR